jgi:hypothetical protein
MGCPCDKCHEGYAHAKEGQFCAIDSHLSLHYLGVYDSEIGGIGDDDFAWIPYELSFSLSYPAGFDAVVSHHAASLDVVDQQPFTVVGCREGQKDRVGS